MRKKRRNEEPEEGPELGEHDMQRCLRRVYVHARRAHALLRILSWKDTQDENLEAAADHSRCLVQFLRDARKERESRPS
jgi:hypothetical protein